jgi:hypothetical protein
MATETASRNEAMDTDQPEGRSSWAKTTSG